MKEKDVKAKNFDILHFVADNAGLSTFEAIEKAYYMGVSEQESCNDAISKSDVFETLGNLMSIPYDFDRPINEKDVSESMDEIVALPPVTPERPKGHWINIDKTHSKCDKCESVFEIVSANGEANYCPNCGCFMSKGGNHEH